MKNAMIILLVCKALFAAPGAYAQAFEWAKEGIGESEGWLVTTDPAGNSFTSGYTTANVTIGSFYLPDSSHKMSMLIAKYNSSGNVVWAKGSKNGNAIPFAISSDKKGNLFILGSFDTTITFDSITLTNPTLLRFDQRGFIAKYDSNGNLLWAKNSINVTPFGTSSNGGIATDNNGNAYIAVPSSDTDTLGSFPLSSIGGIDIVVAKYDANGNVVWAKDFGGSSDDVPNGITVTGKNHLYLTGSTASPSLAFGSAAISVGADGIYVAKLDTAGNELWAQSGKGSSYTYSGGVASDSDENAIITGTFLGSDIVFGADTLTDPAGSAAFVTKYDLTGELMWARKITGSGVTGFSVTTDPCNNIWICGSSGALDDTIYMLGDTLTPPTVGNIDPMYIAGISAAGSLLQKLALPTGGDDPYLNGGIASDLQGNILIANDNKSIMFIAGPDTLPSPSSESIFVAKYNPGLHCGEILNIAETAKENVLNVFPNPSGNELTITSSMPITTISIYNLVGQAVFTGTYHSEEVQLNVTTMPPGVYFVKINNRDVRKFVKE